MVLEAGHVSELDDLERELLQAVDVWFDKRLHMKLQRLVQIARAGDAALRYALASGTGPDSGAAPRGTAATSSSGRSFEVGGGI